MSAGYLNQTSYTPVGDIAVIALCFVVGFLLILSRIHKNGSYKLMAGMVTFIWMAAVSSVIYGVLTGAAELQPVPIYVSRLVNHASLSMVQVLYVLYLREPLWMKNDGYRRFLITIYTIAVVPIVIDLLGIIFRFGFYVDELGTHSDFTIYPFSFIAFAGVIMYLILRYRTRIIKQVFWGLLGVNVLSIIITSLQGSHHQTSFTTFAYFLPVIGLLFMFHSNPYDSETGAANDSFFYKELSGCLEKGTDLIMLSCTITDFYNNLKEMPELKAEFYRFFRQNIKRGVLYRFPNGRFVLTLKKQKGKNYEEMLAAMLDDFYNSHEMFGIDYKLIVAQTTPEIPSAEDYIKLIDFIDSEMPFNRTHRVNSSDIKRFKSIGYILNELDDINRKNDLSDERVLVYCQPVFNIVTGSYDTAEALMRLRLPEIGLVFPDQFIPIAEKHNLIHTLSLIILNKTCRAINELVSEGYILNRVSVNFSTIDIRHDNFCDEVQRIIDSNNIPYESIAVEITESRSELEFNQMKKKVTELQELGIKFYLDDFGTGYSNFERIMEIPFDIIKFDRSMLIESVKNDSSKFMVSTFASMFNDLNYSVLFEGVEDEKDEAHCVNMHASYLQGYKYSKPIPIEDLRHFLTKEAV